LPRVARPVEQQAPVAEITPDFLPIAPVIDASPYAPPAGEHIIVEPMSEGSKRVFLWVAFVSCLTVFVLTARQPPSAAVAVNYVALAGMLFFGVYATVRGRLRYAATAAVGVMLLGSIIWALLDSYEQEFVGLGMLITDTYSRTSDVPRYRKIVGEDSRAEGPMAGDFKPHGKWRISLPSGAQQTSWYWYGEEITEGEWHLRNR
jgi:hypothetical protein